jgi:adenosylmethionine-8-amino-7-oxononanoate aminotransferase
VTDSSSDILALDQRHVWHPYTQEQMVPPPLVAVGGKGSRIQLADGRDLVDLVSSWWVTLHGHGHPAVAAAVAEQAARLEQVIFADFTHAPAATLAARLAAVLPGDLDRVFYSDNGSTAVEVALKVALQYFANRGDDKRRRLLAFQGGYHGDTVGAMSVGKTSGYFRAWEDLLFPVEMLPFPATWIGDEEAPAKEAEAFAALERALADDVAAVIIEPLIQGASGMRMCRPDFLQGLVDRARAKGVLVIFDEVMTGFGRTGDLFACVKAGVEPDMVCLSKGLTGGFLPMGATVVREEIHQAFLGQSLRQAFLHGHSYTANPLGCAAGLASLALLVDADCQARRAAIEAIHRERLADLVTRHAVARPRITGTIAAVDLDDGGYASGLGPKIKAFFLERGFLLRPLGSTIYFLPPYCLAPADLHQAWDILDAAL